MKLTIEMTVSCAICGDELEGAEGVPGEAAVHPCEHCEARKELDQSVDDFKALPDVPAVIEGGTVVLKEDTTNG